MIGGRGVSISSANAASVSTVYKLYSCFPISSLRKKF